MIDYEFTNKNHDPLFQTFLNDIGCFNFEKKFQNIFVLCKHSKGYYAMSWTHQHISPLS